MMNFWGYNWECCMEGGRLIHPDYPYVCYDKDYIREISNETILLSLGPSHIQDIQYWDGNIYHPKYGGGLLRSVKTFSYGTFSAEIYMPEGLGLWPAFWLCGEGPWPDNGEIDICEGYSDNKYLRWTTPYFPWLNPSYTATNNVHYSQNGEHKQIGSRNLSIFKFYSPLNFVRYECVWTPDKIEIYVDNKLARKDNKAVKYFSREDSKMRVIFNLLCEDPATYGSSIISIKSPMIIKNFEYKPL